MTSPTTRTVAVRRVRTPDLSAPELAQLLDLFGTCWPDGDFTADDVAHAMGGFHWLAEAAGRIVGHASVVPRELHVDGVPLTAGYVEAVATHPSWQRRGVASRLMVQANAHIAATYQVGALSTDVPAVYARCGWERWRGPTWVRTAGGLVRTVDEDDGIMLLRTPATGTLALDGTLSVEWRTGDAW